MLLENQFAYITISKINMKWYREKGYDFKLNGVYKVKVEDLQPNTKNVEVKIKCDYQGRNCCNIYTKRWKSHSILIKDPNYRGDYCKSCNGILSGQNRKVDFSKVKEDFLKVGLILISTEDEYINNKSILKAMCPKHVNNLQFKTYNNVSNHNQGCSDCYNEIGKIRENNPNWKGGIMKLSTYLRNQLDDWKIASLQKYNYSCFITGINSQELEIHHTELFSKVRDSIIKEMELPIYESINYYTREELVLMSIKLKENHEKIEGIPMLPHIHKLFHSVYGVKNINIEHVYEFKRRFLDGEYKDLLK